MSERWTGDDAQVAVDIYLAEHLDEAIEELARFCRQPSVATLLREHGCRAEVVASNGNPRLGGERRGSWSGCRGCAC